MIPQTSPLFGRNVPAEQFGAIAISLAAHSTDPVVLHPLLALQPQPLAHHIAQTLDARTDLPLDTLARLVAAHPDIARFAAARLRTHLFPASAGCHRFTQFVAALAHAPERIEAAFLSAPDFGDHARLADPAMLCDLLHQVLTAPRLSTPQHRAVAALAAARRQANPGNDPFLAEALPALNRTRLAELTDPIAALRTSLLNQLAVATGGLTRLLDLWFDTIVTTVHTEDDSHAATVFTTTVERCFATTDATTASARIADDPFTRSHPAIAARWKQVCAAITHATSRTDLRARWDRAWREATSTAEGAVYPPQQRVLVAAYLLLTEHARAACNTHPLASPLYCWAVDPTGRALLHYAADALTGYQFHTPLDRIDDELLIAFVRGLAKNRRDRVPHDLHIRGTVLAVKAARSKSRILEDSQPLRIGIAVPMRDETARIGSRGAENSDGQDAVRVKLTQLAWLIDTQPDASVHVLFVDEGVPPASARATEQALSCAPHTRRVHATSVSYADAVAADHTLPPHLRNPALAGVHDVATDTTKGGAVVWGLGELLRQGCDPVGYTDLDLTYPLEQIGLLISPLTAGSAAAAIASRRRPDSHGYYPPAGPNQVARAYRDAVAELLDMSEISDFQAGCKAFTAGLLARILPQMRDRHLSFDAELLLLTRLAGRTITEVGVSALHDYREGRTGTTRNYDSMLEAVQSHVIAHGIDPTRRPTPTCDLIRATGGITAAAQAHVRNLHISLKQTRTDPGKFTPSS